MAFSRIDSEGKQIRFVEAVIDCQAKIESGEVILRTEQNHKQAVDINTIVASHGLDKIAASTEIMAMSFDENPYNDFQEMMGYLAKGKQAFESLPAAVRKEFHNDPAEYMDYIRNPENTDALIERGWLNPPEEQPVVQVEVINQPEPTTETPPAS